MIWAASGVLGLLGAGGLNAAPPLVLGTAKHLLLDDRYIERSSNVRLTLNQPQLPHENFLVQDKPWERQRAGIYSALLKDENGYKLYYDAFDDASYTRRYLCLATSVDGVHWEKPEFGLIEHNGSTRNNIVALDRFGVVFRDGFDTAARRYKMLSRGGPADLNNTYLFTSPDGIRWSRDPQAVLPFYLGAPTPAFWDDSLGKWIVYPRGYTRNPSGIRVYTRVALEKDGLSRPFPIRVDPARPPVAPGKTRGLLDELPSVLQTDDTDPVGAQIYTMCSSKYDEAQDVYVAFPSVWYSRWKWYGGRLDPGASDTLDVQFAFSRDGVRWNRPFRQAVVPNGQPGSNSEGQIYAAGLVRSGDEMHLYYSAVPGHHLQLGKDPVPSVTARAIFRLDGFVSLDTGYAQEGEFTTPAVTFDGNQLQVNAITGGGGYVKVEVQDAEGKPIPGFSLADAVRVTGNSVRHAVSWSGSEKLGSLAGRTVRLRFVMRDSRLYAFQFRP